MRAIDRVVEVISVEKIRDGGSFAVVFNDESRQKWWLFFKIQLEADESSRTERTIDKVRTGYGPPALRKRGKDATREAVSWDDALELLHGIKDRVPDRLDADKWWSAMVRIAEAKGTPLPDDPDLGPARSTWHLPPAS